MNREDRETVPKVGGRRELACINVWRQVPASTCGECHVWETQNE